MFFETGSERSLCGTEMACEIPQAQAFFRRTRSYQNVSRETLLSDWGLKPYKAEDSGPFSMV